MTETKLKQQLELIQGDISYLYNQLNKITSLLGIEENNKPLEPKGNLDKLDQDYIKNHLIVNDLLTENDFTNDNAFLKTLKPLAIELGKKEFKEIVGNIYFRIIKEEEPIKNRKGYILSTFRKELERKKAG